MTKMRFFVNTKIRKNASSNLTFFPSQHFTWETTNFFQNSRREEGGGVGALKFLNGGWTFYPTLMMQLHSVKEKIKTQKHKN